MILNVFANPETVNKISPVPLPEKGKPPKSGIGGGFTAALDLLVEVFGERGIHPRSVPGGLGGTPGQEHDSSGQHHCGAGPARMNPFPAPVPAFVIPPVAGLQAVPRFLSGVLCSRCGSGLLRPLS